MNNHKVIMRHSAPLEEVDSMLETENAGLRERVNDLEKRVLEQGDELVCLRSTLADVLRRMNQVEAQPRPGGPITLNGGSHPVRLRYQVSPAEYKDPIRRSASSHVPTALPQRQRGHHTSTGSLHSDPPSSQSVSPVPTSPSPTHPPVSTPPQPLPRNTSNNSNLHTAKRWSSTGDFNQTHGSNASPVHSPMMPGSRLATKSLFNLYLKPQQQHSTLKHGTKDSSWNGEDGTLRIYLRGRPVVLHAPTDLVERYDVGKVATPPSARLKIDWVYGYRGKDCRNNLYLLPTGELVYFVAAVVVLHDTVEQAQRHYLGHTDDVRCMCVHPNKLLVATGQVAGHTDARPHIRVWNSVSLQTICTVGLGDFDRSICCLSFSKADGGVMLCAVDEAADHNISVWDWQKGDRGVKITETKCSADTVVACEFHPLDRHAIVTCGKSHIAFWQLDGNGTLYKRMGVFEVARDKPKFVTCIAFTQQGDVLSGDSNGNVVAWGRGTNTVLKVVKAVHQGSVFSLCALKDGSVVSGGGKDGRLVQLDGALNRTGVQAELAERHGAVRVVAEGRGSQLIVGTTRNCVLMGGLSLGFSAVVVGHTDELWALAVHPELPQFVTAGWDKLLHLWDSMSHSIVWSKELPEAAQSADFSPDGSTLLVGCASGRWLVLDVHAREVNWTHQDGAEPMQVVKYSPDGSHVALGSRDNNIYVYQVGEAGRKYGRVGRCMGHSSFITHLDWSADGQYIQSNSGDYELLFWNVSVCRQIPQSSQMRDTVWASNSCVLTFKTLGIWPENADGTDVNFCDRSNDSRLLATADDFGKVKLYSYPATQPKSLCHTYGGHSSHVTSVKFLRDDSRLISTGGRDTSVIQWAIS